MRQVDAYELWFVLKYELTRARPSIWRDAAARTPEKRARAIDAAVSHLMARVGKWTFFGHAGASAVELAPAAIAHHLREVLAALEPATHSALAGGANRGELCAAIATRLYARLSTIEILVQEPGKSSAGVGLQDPRNLLPPPAPGEPPA